VQRLKLRNRLLAALPHEVLSSLRPDLKPVSLPRGRVLCDAEEPLKRVYFVEAGLVSLVSVFEDGTTPEMATVGREGMVLGMAGVRIRPDLAETAAPSFGSARS
jgi:CRP-like cAMP-binding protein